MSTQVSVTQPRTTTPRPTLTAVEKRRVYTPEEVVELKLIRCKVRWLKDMAYARRIPFAKQPGGIGFRLDHIDAINASFEECWPEGFSRAA